MINNLKTHIWVFITAFILVNSCSMESKKNKDFPIALESSVFTTSFIIEGGMEITTVMHDTDGDWQFFSDDEFEDFEKVAKLVSLKQIINLDSTILELSQLPKGKTAQRRSVNASWKINNTK